MPSIWKFIGSDVQKSNEVREAVEACCQKIGGKLLFIVTGQTAVTGTANLRQLAGRFTLPVELTDADVEEVIRQVILAKQPGAIQSIDQVMEGNLGEISRHLSGTSLRHTRDDLEVFAQDYPILPVRRRFWENTLRVLDQTGTESQLRNQLSMIHKGVRKKTTPGSGVGTAATISPAVPSSPANASTTAIIRLKPSERRENATVTMVIRNNDT